MKTKTRILCYLAYAVVLSSMVVGGTLARYTQTSTGSGEAQIAAYVIKGDTTQVSTIDLINMSPGDEVVYDLSVYNYDPTDLTLGNAEVTQDYNISITTGNNLPLQYKLEPISGGGVSEIAETTTTGTPETYTSGDSQLSFNDKIEHEYKLTISWDATQNSYAYMGVPESIKIVVTGEQVD